MPLWTKIKNLFRRDQLNAELEEEIQSHLHEAAARGRDAQEARLAFGNLTNTREASLDIKLAAGLDNLGRDVTFAGRQLWKNKVASFAAIVSLALAVGACTSSFRLIDALLFRPLPVAHVDRLRVVTNSYTDAEGKRDYSDSFNYPLFRTLRKALQQEASLIAIGYTSRQDITFGSDKEMERAHRQYVSGWTFGAFGLQPAHGRLFTENDDLKPGSHPVAVLTYSYWRSRFGLDPKVLGKTFRLGKQVYEIVGVSPEGFTGTETGTPADFFIPMMMESEAINEAGWSWFRTWAALKPGASSELVRQKCEAIIRAHRAERVKQWPPGAPQGRIEQYLNTRVELQHASAGYSGAQKQYRKALAILGVLVGLVLLIACANVANLTTAQASARAREMALRVSIGAGRLRLFQMMLVESALVALCASVLGFAFALWSAPAVMNRINPPDNPLRLDLPSDARVFLFVMTLGFVVTLAFGLVPALCASSVRPAAALKGGEDPHSKRRLMHALVAAQVAFCFIVHFVAGLFLASSDRLSHQPLGFSPDRVLTLDAATLDKMPPEAFEQVVEHLRAVPGVEAAGLSGWPLMSGSGWNSDVYVNGAPPHPVSPYFLSISPAWLAAMKIPLLAGRDFRNEDAYPRVAIVNESFAKKYFDGQDPIGKVFEKDEGRNPVRRVRIEIVGLVKDARYRNMRDAIPATAYFPYRSVDEKGVAVLKKPGCFLVRTASSEPLALASILRKAVPSARPEFRVSNIRTQQELVDQHTVRDRLLAVLGAFFALVALVLAAVGLYGVLDYSVLQRRREIGIRMALGAQPLNLAWRVSAGIFGMLFVGSAAGLTLGLLSERYIESLLFGVKVTDWRMLASPVATIIVSAILAAILPIVRAIRIDPVTMVRAE
ncbi:MAG: ABC transporter permease [Bryobacterales bacterium]|nr:ABC transporter permease [Bryobacterales bacterium]